jgi:glycosyltransferase involved in cell wall biosynthesis
VPAVRRADALSGVSPYTARHVERVLRARGPVAVIPNGVRPGDLPRAPIPAATERPVFATVLNGWGPLKNGQAALRAFGRARAQLPGARLLMFGEGFTPDGPAAVRAEREGLVAGVEFVGPVGHRELLDRLAAEVTVVIHPSRLEACPMILLEAMAVGVPIIAGRRSGAVPWVLGDGAAGLLVDVGSSAEIAAAMVRLAGDPRARARLAAAGRDRVGRHFDLDEIAATYVRWFEAGIH